MKRHVLRLLSLQRKTQGVLEGVVCVVQPKAPGVLGGGGGNGQEPDRVPFVTTINPALPNINHIISDNLNILHSSQRFKEVPFSFSYILPPLQ